MASSIGRAAALEQDRAMADRVAGRLDLQTPFASSWSPENVSIAAPS